MARELDVRGSFRFGNVFGHAVDAIAHRRIDVRPVISPSQPLAQAARAIELARDKTRSMKVHLVPA
jgi:L-idonate 5-dehydrogenase